MRMYDPRVGRFLSVDPLAGKYPFYTPYQFAGNTPIKFIDIDGEEPGNSGIQSDGPDLNETKKYTSGALIIHKPTLDPVSKVGVRMIRTLVMAFGAGTQVAGAMEYGDKIP